MDTSTVANNNPNNQLASNSENQFSNVNNTNDICTDPVSNSTVGNLQEQHVSSTNLRGKFLLF